MKKKSKILVSDLLRGEDLDIKLPVYSNTLSELYHTYATVRASMNYYTAKEIAAESESGHETADEALKTITELLSVYLLEGSSVTEDALSAIDSLRTSSEKRMQVLTAYTDALQMYEYVLNRIKEDIKGGAADVDTEALSARMYRYVFSEKDTVVINSKLQLLMGQLPVRMTKNKFYDILGNTLNIYQGGETSSVDAFADMLRMTVLITKPEGFEDYYPDLYTLYEDLEQADYKEISEHGFDDLAARMTDAGLLIKEEVSRFMLLQEIINDVYVILLTKDVAAEAAKSGAGYAAAIEILRKTIAADDMDAVSEDLMDQFMTIEGVQEEIYEEIMILESVFDEMYTGHRNMIEQLGLLANMQALSKITKLLSTSLFVALDDTSDAKSIPCDHDYIEAVRKKLVDEFGALFAAHTKQVNRSVMAKILSAMPIFLNTTQEIKDYFDYVLGSCSDRAELSATAKLIEEIIEDETA